MARTLLLVASEMTRESHRAPSHEPPIVHEMFAAGPVATTHFGWDAMSAQLVAVKRVHPHLLDDHRFVDLLLEQTDHAIKVDHPNVVSTMETVCRPEEILVVTDYAPGASLAEILARTGQGLDPRYACAIARAMLRGLFACHEAGVMHGDVAPRHVIVGRDGLTRVVGLGLASAEASVVSLGASILTRRLPYVSPDQLTWSSTDPRADVYATAAVLWEALTGRCLFPETPSVVIRRKLQSDPALPPSAVVAVPPVLDAIVLRGLARDPHDRYASAREMADDLERAIDVAPPDEVGAWIERLSVPAMTKREAIARIVRTRHAAERDAPLAGDGTR